MRNSSVTSQLQNVDVPRNVRVYVCGGIFERIAHTGLGPQVNYPINFLFGQRMRESPGIAKIDIQK